MDFETEIKDMTCNELAQFSEGLLVEINDLIADALCADDEERFDELTQLKRKLERAMLKIRIVKDLDTLLETL